MQETALVLRSSNTDYGVVYKVFVEFRNVLHLPESVKSFLVLNFLILVTNCKSFEFLARLIELVLQRNNFLVQLLTVLHQAGILCRKPTVVQGLHK